MILFLMSLNFPKIDYNDRSKRYAFKSNELKVFAVKVLHLVPTKSRSFFQVRHHNIKLLRLSCIMTKRKQAVLSKVSLSRISFRDKLHIGLLPGFRKF